MSIYRTVYQVEVFSEEPVQDYDLPAVFTEMDSGEYIGNVERVSQEIVPNDKVKSELLRIGNDGLFFDYLGEDYE
jgi:hypothetical protein